MILAKEILMDRDKEYPLSEQLKANLADLLTKLNRLRVAYGKPMIVSSGYRPGAYNVKAGGAAKSLHQTCQACDFLDKDGQLDLWLMKNVRLLQDIGLYIEHPDWTPGWSHIQCVAPLSGSTVFKPGTKKP